MKPRYVLYVTLALLGVFFLSLIFFPQILFSIDEKYGMIKLFVDHNDSIGLLVIIYIICVVAVVSASFIFDIFYENKIFRKIASLLANQLGDFMVSLFLMLPFVAIASILQGGLFECNMFASGYGHSLEEILAYDSVHPGLLESCTDLILFISFVGIYLMVVAFQGLAKISIFGESYQVVKSYLISKPK